MKEAKILGLGLILILGVATAFYVVIDQNDFPAFHYAPSDGHLIDTNRSIGQEMSLFMWDQRGIDLVAQAFVLFAAATGCLSILRKGNTEEGTTN